jgi:hypothetical protein
MRPVTTLAAIVAGAAALLFAVVGYGADSEDLAPTRAADTGPRHELLGSWKTGRSGKLALERRRRSAQGRVTRAADVAGCRVPAGVVLLRSLRFVRRAGEADVWAGRLALPDPARDCRRRTVSVRLRVADDLRMRAIYRGRERQVLLRFRRIRPKPHDDDPVLGVWERKGVGIQVVRRGRAYVASARRAYLLTNLCTVPAGTVVWRLRPLAPGRYDGTAQTFLPPPDCSPAERTPSRWVLAGERSLVRIGPDGSRTRYTRVEG